MGFLHAGICHETSIQAQSAYFGSNSFDFDGGVTTYVNTIVYDTASAAFRHKSYTVSSTGVWAAKANTVAITPSFPTCTPVNGAFDYTGAAAIFSFFFSFVVGTWYVSKNFGLILAAVRRF